MLVKNANGGSEVFDPMSTTKCNTLASYPIASNYDAAGDVLDGVPIICGGAENSLYVAHCYKYDLSNNKWVFFADMGKLRGGHAAVVTDGGRLWITGGVDHEGTLLDFTEFLGHRHFQSALDSGPKLPTERAEHCMVRLIDGRIMIIGGKTNNGGDKKVIIYEPKSQTFGESVEMKFTREEHVCALFFSKMHNGRPVVVAIAGKNDRSVELLDYTTPGAIWEESKIFSSS